MLYYKLYYNNKNMMSCEYCSIPISRHHNIYRGFDCTFCSQYCRNEIAKINAKLDPKMSCPEKWYNYKKLDVDSISINMDNMNLYRSPSQSQLPLIIGPLSEKSSPKSSPKSEKQMSPKILSAKIVNKIKFVQLLLLPLIIFYCT